jgi:hypothetical protein
VEDKRAHAIVRQRKLALRPTLTYMLEIMRDPAADHKRRDAMATAAAPYLPPKVSSVEAKRSPAVPEPSPRKIEVVFVVPSGDQTGEDQE